jgi:hypothetical protein
MGLMGKGQWSEKGGVEKGRWKGQGDQGGCSTTEMWAGGGHDVVGFGYEEGLEFGTDEKQEGHRDMLYWTDRKEKRE